MKRRDFRLGAAGFLLIAACYGLARFAFGLFLPDISHDLHLSATFSGVISGGSFVGYCIAIVAAAGLTERFGPRYVAALAGVIAALGLAAMALAPTGIALGFAVLFAGLSTGLASPPMAAAVDVAVADGRKDTVNTLINAGASGGVALTGPAALLLGADWRLAFGIFSAAALAVAVLILFVSPARNAEHDTATGGMPRLTASLRRLVVAAFLMGAASTAVWSFGGQLTEIALGWNNRLNGILWIVIGSVGLFGALAGRLIERFGLDTIHRVCLGLMAIAILCVAMPLDSAMAFVGGGLFGLAYICLTGVYLVWGVDALASRPATGLTIGFLAIAIGQTAGAPLFGFLLEQWAAPTAAIVFAAAAMGAGFIRYRTPSRRRTHGANARPCRAAGD